MWRRTYARYSWVADEVQKKKVLGIYIGNYKTYTRYSRVADEKKGAIWKKSLGNPCINCIFYWFYDIIILL